MLRSRSKPKWTSFQLQWTCISQPQSEQSRLVARRHVTRRLTGLCSFLSRVYLYKHVTHFNRSKAKRARPGNGVGETRYLNRGWAPGTGTVMVGLATACTSWGWFLIASSLGTRVCCYKFQCGRMWLFFPFVKSWKDFWLLEGGKERRFAKRKGVVLDVEVAKYQRRIMCYRV